MASILRLMLVDLVVFVPTLVAVIINGLLLRAYGKGSENREGEESRGAASVESQVAGIRLQEQPLQQGTEYTVITIHSGRYEFFNLFQ